ncbi:hypothetical protein [Senegalia massiliensis]|uniref:hypothetical protein n=1 Tax=Senegalia massiliensis TaxID=1720316 RepID=UPI001030EF27|nr:hypothetical protein [Senegalia massiliensis]
MARGRKSKYIKKITSREEILFKQLSNAGMCTVEQAKTYCNLNRDRLLKLERSNYIKLEKTAPIGGKMTEVIRLDTKARNYCENNIGVQYFYKSNLNQVTHDLKLAESYYQIMNDNPNAIWKNETQIAREYPEALIDGKDCVDAIVEVNGDSFAVEVIGHKYTQETIDNKVTVGNRVAGRTCLV